MIEHEYPAGGDFIRTLAGLLQCVLHSLKAGLGDAAYLLVMTHMDGGGAGLPV